MEAIKVTKTIEEITGYEAFDGTWFREEEECRKYEQSARGVASKAALSKQIGSVYADDAFPAFSICCEDRIVTYDIKTAEDLQIVNTWLNLLPDKRIIDSKYIGHKVLVDIWIDEDGATIMGTRQEMEEKCKKMLDKLFCEEVGSDAG